jgi:hypothetical protein
MFNPTPGKPDNEPEPQPLSPANVQMPASYQPDPAIEDEAYTYALERLLPGIKPREICKSLIEMGYTKPQADMILQTALQFQRDDDAKQADYTQDGQAIRLMAAGAAACLVGVAISLVAVAVMRGAVVVALAPIFWGLIQFGRGAWKWFRL